MADPQTNKRCFICCPFSVGSLMLLYLLFVWFIGPKWMSDRQPYQLKKAIQFHNLFQILVGFKLAYQGSYYWFSQYDTMCGSLQRFGEHSIEQTDYIYLHFITKLIALSHTVMLILSKKITILYPHVIHDFLLVGTSWCCVKYYPGSHCLYIAFVNATIALMVHSMYLIVEGIEIYDILWIWKKRINAIKAVQYQIIILHFIEVYFFGCDYGKLHLIFVIPFLFFIANTYLNYDHERKIDEFFKSLNENPAPKSLKNN